MSSPQINQHASQEMQVPLKEQLINKIEAAYESLYEHAPHPSAVEAKANQMLQSFQPGKVEGVSKVSSVGDYKTHFANMSKEEIGQFRRDVRYSSSANGKFEDFVARSSNEELAAEFGDFLKLPPTNNTASPNQLLGDYMLTQKSAPQIKDMVLKSALSNADQSVGGKMKYTVDNAPEEHMVHRTGVSRYTRLETGSELFQVDAQMGYRTGGSSTSRSEAYFTPNGGTSGKTFSADYQVTDAENTTIFQQKDSGAGGPSIRVSVKDGEFHIAHSGSGGPGNLGRIAEGEKFNLNVEDTGRGFSNITITGEDGRTIGHGAFANDRNGIEGNKQFRYGAYTQPDERGAVNVLVDNVTVG